MLVHAYNDIINDNERITVDKIYAHHIKRAISLSTHYENRKSV